MSRQKSLRASLVGGVLAGVVMLVGWTPSPGAAQDMDSRWLPWLGCWEAAEAGVDVPLLCVQPAAQGEGVEFVTWMDGQTTSSETILADAIPRNAEREECVGMEEARFSQDGHRVYLSSDYACEGGMERSVSGILAMVNPMEWVDIKVVDGQPWVLRYRLARASRVQEAGLENPVAPRASAVKAARIAASASLTEEDLMEAVGSVDGKAVEALIVERGDPFAINAEMLLRLDDAGVSDGVIDLVVAVSNPDRFVVKAGSVPVEEIQPEQAYGAPRSMYMGSRFYSPWYGYGLFGYSPYAFGYSPYSYGYGYGGYGSYGRYGYGYGYGYPYYRTSPIVVTPRSGGRMIKGQGYTGPGGSTGYTGRTARPRSGTAGVSGGARSPSSGAVRGGSSTGRTAKPRGSGGSSSVTRSGASSSSGSAVRRTAKPRTGGGSSGSAVRTTRPKTGGGSSGSAVRTTRPRTSGGGGL